MKRQGIYFACALLGLTLGLVTPAVAQDGDDGLFTGEFYVGYRSTSVDGTETKYKEDINLDDGPRLFGLRFEYVPGDGLREVVDRVSLDISNFGGDPFETFRLDVEKYGRYDFEFRRTESDYFYEDIILPVDQAGNPALALAGDFHHFDFRRQRDVANFSYHFNDRATFDVGFERFTKRGESTTTLDVSRDEFELDKPVHESYDNLSLAFQYRWDKVTLILEEQVRDYENDVEIFLPGASLGEDPEDATTLDFFFLNQPYSYDANNHIVRLNFKPDDRWIIRAAANIQDLDLDVEADEQSQGTAFTGAPLATDAVGEGSIQRDVELFDVDFTYLINDRVALVGGARQHNLDQDGEFFFDGGLREGVWEIETTGAELGIQYHVSPTLTVGAGILDETRDVDHGSAEAGEELEIEETETSQTGLYASLNWRPTKTYNVDVVYEDGSYDDPFALTSPTDRSRLQLKIRGAFESGLFWNGTYLLRSYENSDSGWDADLDTYALRLGYRAEGLTASAGYTVIESERAIDQTLITAPGFGGGQMIPFPIFYESDSDFFDCRIHYEVDSRWAVGGDVRFYENSGSFPLERDDWRLYVETDIGQGYLLHLGYRTVDYDEGNVDFDDYEADILELAVGYRW